MKKIIVTGANGFLGQAMVRKLSQDDTIVYAVCKEFDNSAYKKENIRYISLGKKTMLDLPELLLDIDFDCMYYFAWVGSAGPLRSDYECQLENIKNICQTVEIANKINCKKIIFAASIMEYECIASFKENSIPSTSNIYSVSKLSAHYIAQIIAKNNNIDFFPIVISNVFGEGENSPRLINSTIKKILNGESVDLTEGTQMYDFIYIEDAINAIIAVANNGVPFKDYYLGSPSTRPLKEFLIELSESFDEKPIMNFGAIKFTGVSLDYYKEFDIYAIKNDTGFVPKYNFNEGIKKTINWIKNTGENHGKF